MAKSRDPFLRALDEIRVRALAGGYPPARPIIIIEEARRLGLSTTPIREALSHLCGEGLVDRGPSGGFLASRLDPGAVRDRYEFRLACLLAALDLTAGLPAYGRLAPSGGELKALFESVVLSTGNTALVAAYHRVDRQLHQFQEAEANLLPDIEAEAERLLVLASEETQGAFREALRAHHHRRSRAATLLVMEVVRRNGEVSSDGARP